MATSILSDRFKLIDQLTHDTHPKVHAKDYTLESCCFLPDGNEATCRMRNLATRALRQVLASRLFLMPFGKDEAYLLECVKSRTIGGQ